MEHEHEVTDPQPGTSRSSQLASNGSPQKANERHFELEYHCNKLKLFCRLCGKPKLLQSESRRKNPVPVSKYKNILLRIYNEDVTKDSEVLHPPFLCESCRMKLDYLQKRVRAKKTVKKEKSAKVFEPHSLSCEICGFSVRRTPRKISKKNYSSTPSSSVTLSVSGTLKKPASIGKDSAADTLNKPASGVKRSASKALNKNDIPPKKARKTLAFIDTVSDSAVGDLPLPSDVDLSGEESVDSVDLAVPLEDPAFVLSLVEDKIEEVQISSIPVDSFIEHDLANAIKCQLCKGVPTLPVSTDCGHLYCRPCLNTYMKLQNTCITCKNILETPPKKLPDLKVFAEAIFQVLHVKCKYAVKGCQVHTTVDNLHEHERECRYGKYRAAILREPSNIKRGPGLDKIPLAEATKQYVKKQRLKPLIDYLDTFCNERYESKLDVLYFLLQNELYSLGDREKAKVIGDLWQTKLTGGVLTPEESLALRVETLQSKTQYKKQYDFFKNRAEIKFSPPNAVNKIEDNFMPESTDYEIIKGGNVIFKNEAKNEGPVDVMESFSYNIPEVCIPNMKGVRWHYASALARTLFELDELIEENLQAVHLEGRSELEIITYVKDGGDGMGEIAVHKEKGDRYLPDKALRFSFCVLECTAEHEGNTLSLFQEPNPNSVRRNRPLLEALADENCKASATVCIEPIEREREALKGTILKLQVGPDKYRLHKLKFISSMLDEKYDRALGGLEASGSSYLCTMCHATRESAINNLGEFSITRTHSETSNLANYLKINPDKLSHAQMQKVVKGVKSVPILLSQPKERMVDATHADINMASFFKKLIVRCIAKIYQWDATQNIKKDLEKAEYEFDQYIKKHVGNNPVLMMPGNYARMLFDERSESHVLALVDKEQQDMLKKILCKFRKMRSVYRANSPDMNEVSQYKKGAVELGSLLKEHFSFCRWPNYLHKLIEHVQELIEDKSGPGSIGAVSGEGNEAGNKVFRHFRKYLAGRGTTQQGLVDVLRVHWLYSSPALQSIAQISRRKHKCGICSQEGHNRLTCPERNTHDDATIL